MNVAKKFSESLRIPFSRTGKTFDVLFSVSFFMRIQLLLSCYNVRNLVWMFAMLHRAVWAIRTFSSTWRPTFSRRQAISVKKVKWEISCNIRHWIWHTHSNTLTLTNTKAATIAFYLQLKCKDKLFLNDVYISPLILVFGNIAIYIRIKLQDAQHAFFYEKSLIQM